MARVEVVATFDCPHCLQGYEMGDDAIFTDDVEDECASQCKKCGEWYQLRCEAVEVEMVATKAAKPQERQSE